MVLVHSIDSLACFKKRVKLIAYIEIRFHSARCIQKLFVKFLGVGLQDEQTDEWGRHGTENLDLHFVDVRHRLLFRRIP